MQIDKQALLDWLRSKEYPNIRIETLIEEIEFGTFNIKKEISEFKIGDRVEHIQLKYNGTIKKISKSGKTVRIVRDGQKWADGNVHIGNIRLIKEDTDHADRG